MTSQMDKPQTAKPKATSDHDPQSDVSASGPHSTGQKFLDNVKSELPFFLGVLGVVFTFRLLFFGMNYIPSESMQPALEVGDRIVVNKFVYGYSRHTVPFSLAPKFPGQNGRIFGRTPKRGEVVTFKNPLQDNKIFIKRVVGLAGDTVQYRGGSLFVNGINVSRTKIANFDYRSYRGGVLNVTHYEEKLDDGKSYEIFEQSDGDFADNTPIFEVPEGHIFVMGDNRDNSIDSRYLERGVGYLPIENLLGRADRILFSTYRCKKAEGLRCAKRGLFKAIN